MDVSAGSAPFADRAAAGVVLSHHLTAYEDDPRVVVLALPRGGVPVAAPLAARLGAPLDVLVVRKLGVPGHPEVAMGAIAGIGATVELVHEERVRARAHVTLDDLDRARRRELVELHRREAAYRGGRPAPRLAGRVVLLVDDGLATGATMRAAVAAVRGLAPARVVVAVPVGSDGGCAALARVADDVVCVRRPAPFRAVGQAYADFDPPSDDEVRALLARGGGAGATDRGV
ncbi:phosphoribosyltransferase [Cellulomonas avistercoris]|uniref:phosphoribosyltransferase n=1 Tax=Cellulomonas avistercoris TaxID=2762242 RepID=UPI00296AF264|nr:phosphoribosyltransferase family protein [Cellulomonas avistercoris]